MPRLGSRLPTPTACQSLPIILHEQQHSFGLTDRVFAEIEMLDLPVSPWKVANPLVILFTSVVAFLIRSFLSYRPLSLRVTDSRQLLRDS